MASFDLIYSVDDQNDYFDLFGGAVSHNQMVNKFNSLKNNLIPTIIQGVSQNDIQQLKGYIRGYLLEGNEFFLAIFCFSNETVYNHLFDSNRWAFSYVGTNKINNIDMLENVRLSNLISSGIVSSPLNLSNLLAQQKASNLLTTGLTSLLSDKSTQQKASNLLTTGLTSLLSSKSSQQNIPSKSTTVLGKKK